LIPRTRNRDRLSTQAALLETIAAVQGERRLGVLLITHDRLLADTWCDETTDIRDVSIRAARGTTTTTA
jgi:ABC-type dipeptide/oligopeptide/nickel transport system ATPase component